MMDAKMTSTVRFELSTFFQNLKQQDEYFKASNYHKNVVYANRIIEVVRKVINTQRCTYHISIEEMIKSFFSKEIGCKHTIMAHDENMVAFIYAKSQMSSKFVGIMHETPKRFNVDAAKTKYLLPDVAYTEY